MSDELTGPMVDPSHSSYNAGSGNTPAGPSNSGTPTGYNRRINGNAGNGAGGANGNGGHPTHYDQLPSVVSPSYEPRKMMRDMSADRDMQDTVVDMGGYPYDDSTSIPKMRRFSTTGLTPSDEKMMVTLLEKLEHVSTSLPGPEATTVHHRKVSTLVATGVYLQQMIRADALAGCSPLLCSVEPTSAEPQLWSHALVGQLHAQPTHSSSGSVT